MTTQIQAQLYLADQRGRSQTAYATSYHTFNFGRYVNEFRKPFGSLSALNDNTLAAGYSLNRHVDQRTHVVLIPVVGGLEFDSSVGQGFVQTGQAQVFSLDTGMTLMVRNPYETEVINFIEIWLAHPTSHVAPAHQRDAVDLLSKNILLPFFELTTEAEDTTHQHFTGFIGRYDGRRKGVYRTPKAEGQPQPHGIFVFILSGAVEVQDRLLQPGDGLALTSMDGHPIDFEALSKEAIILLIEIP
ncbi:hypothetical protein GCM10028818_59490 [Spirosoma horti]